MRFVSLIGLGNLPFRMPSHHDVFPTGINGGIGGFAFLLPSICFIRKNPVSGSWFIVRLPCSVKDEVILERPVMSLAEFGFENIISQRIF